MDFSEPIRALIPGVTGQVLDVVLQTSMPLSGRSVAELAGVSHTQATRVLSRLVDLGMVRGQPAPPAVLYSLAEDHVAVAPLRSLSRVHSTFVGRLAEEVAGLNPTPSSVGVFGSFARREARADSDIDLLVVRPHDVSEDDEQWRTVVETVRANARRLSGNRTEVLEVGENELRGLLRSRRRLWREIARDFLPIHGPSPVGL